MEVHLQMLNGESTDFDDRLRCNLVEMRLTFQLDALELDAKRFLNFRT